MVKLTNTTLDTLPNWILQDHVWGFSPTDSSAIYDYIQCISMREHSTQNPEVSYNYPVPNIHPSKSISCDLRCVSSACSHKGSREFLDWMALGLSWSKSVWSLWWFKNVILLNYQYSVPGAVFLIDMLCRLFILPTHLIKSIITFFWLNSRSMKCHTAWSNGSTVI